MTLRPPGIYLGLSNEEYHADGAISSTGIKDLLKSPYRYWYFSDMNPDPNKEERINTSSTKLGTAFHTLILEPENFDYSFDGLILVKIEEEIDH